MLIKCIYKDFVHRCQVDDPTKYTYEQLLQTVRNFTGIPSGFTIQYTDDEMESVTIGSSEELLEAFRIAENDGRHALRLFVVPTSSIGPLSVNTQISESSAVFVNNNNSTNPDDTSSSDGFEFVDDPDNDLQVATKDSQQQNGEKTSSNVSAATVEGIPNSDSFFANDEIVESTKLSVPTTNDTTTNDEKLSTTTANDHINDDVDDVVNIDEKLPNLGNNEGLPTENIGEQVI